MLVETLGIVAMYAAADTNNQPSKAFQHQSRVRQPSTLRDPQLLNCTPHSVHNKVRPCYPHCLPKTPKQTLFSCQIPIVETPNPVLRSYGATVATPASGTLLHHTSKEARFAAHMLLIFDSCTGALAPFSCKVPRPTEKKRTPNTHLLTS